MTDMTSSLPAAVLFDMDGTLVDTEGYWIAAERALAAEHGVAWTDADVEEVIGTGLWSCAEVMRTRGVPRSVDEIVTVLTAAVAEQIRTLGAPYRPGAIELLRELRAAGVPTALVTMSVRSMAALVVDAIDFDAFDTLVTGDVVEHAKPHPEPYLTAAARLGVDPADCIAIEDSGPGVRSAADAGMVAIGIPHGAPIAPSSDYTLIETLAGVHPADLVDLATAFRARAAQ